MRIAIIAPPWIPVPPPAYGGIELVLDVLARGLRRAGHEVLLFATGDSTCPVDREWLLTEAVGTGRPDSTLLETRHVIAAYEAAADFDIVHDHTLAGPIYGAGFTDKRVVATNHGPFADGLDEYYAAVSRRVPVIAISRSQAATAHGVRLAGTIRHGIEIERFPFGGGGGGYALFLGRMSPNKGVHIAAKVARIAGVPLLIAGRCSEPNEVAYFEERVRPLLSDEVQFIGEVGGRTKLELLGGASCLLNPLDWPEPFGMVMLESLACGTPVVSTHKGAAQEIVEEGVTGALADTPIGLADAMHRVLAIDRARCRARAAERFSAEHMVGRHLAVYERLRMSCPRIQVLPGIRLTGLPRARRRPARRPTVVRPHDHRHDAP